MIIRQDIFREPQLCLLAHFPDTKRAVRQIQFTLNVSYYSFSKPTPEQSVKSCVYKNEKGIKL